MKRAFYSLLAAILILLSFSCDLKPMEEGENINSYIYPYLEFTPSEDGNGYTVTVVDGAELESVVIPAEVEIDGVPVAVTSFAGFSNPEDSKKMKSITLESEETVISDTAFSSVNSGITVNYPSSEEERLWNLPALSHTYEKEFLGWYLPLSDVEIHNGDVMVPGYTEVEPRWGEHSYSKTEKKDATCTETGWKEYEVCSSCGHSTKEEIPALGHSLPLILHSASSPTCISTGCSSAWYECSRCSGTFSDENALSTLDLDSITIPRSGHTSDGKIYKNESQHWWHCTVEDSNYGNENHIYTDWIESDDVLYQERTCTVCAYTQREKKEHSWEKVESVEATCTEKGHTEYWKCRIHEGEYSLDENGGEIVFSNKLAERTGIDEKGHSLSSWQSSSDSHWRYCTVCNEESGRESHDYEYTFNGSAETRQIVVERRCIVCLMEAKVSSGRSSAFDITAVFGDISVRKTGTNTWNLSYTGSSSYCYWSDERGERIIDGGDPFSISYTSSGKGTIRIFCHITDSEGRDRDVAFAALQTN